MNTTARTILSASIAAALGLFTLISAIFAGLGSTATITGISLYVALGVIEIMLHSYAEPSDLLSRARDASETPTAGAIVAFPTKVDDRRAA